MKREKLLDRGGKADVTVRKSLAGTVLLLTKQQRCVALLVSLSIIT